MKKILYICPKNQYDWNVFIPQEVSSPKKEHTEEIDISVLLLQNGIHLDQIPTSHISLLKTEGGKKDSSNSYESISYQDFLEKIFLADLALVI
jgi:hypothetical protein